MAERWDAQPDGAPLDVLREMGTLTAEVICRAVFGPRLGTEHATEIAASFSEYQRLVGRLDLQYLVGLPDWVPRLNSWRDPPRGAAHPRRCSTTSSGECRERHARGEVVDDPAAARGARSRDRRRPRRALRCATRPR